MFQSIFVICYQNTAKNDINLPVIQLMNRDAKHLALLYRNDSSSMTCGFYTLFFFFFFLSLNGCRNKRCGWLESWGGSFMKDRQKYNNNLCADAFTPFSNLSPRLRVEYKHPAPPLSAAHRRDNVWNIFPAAFFVCTFDVIGWWKATQEEKCFNIMSTRWNGFPLVVVN